MNELVVIIFFNEADVATRAIAFDRQNPEFRQAIGDAIKEGNCAIVKGKLYAPGEYAPGEYEPPKRQISLALQEE